MPPADGPRWTEAALEALPGSEHDFREFKSSLVASRGRIVATGVRESLSRQVSAFSNGAGGTLFIGIDDDGRIDGGVPIDLKGGGTRAWLEDVIPGTVDPPLKQFNVFEVRSGSPRRRPSRIRPGHGVYVIEIPSSEDAPHQALDKRYYLRIAGKSRPMGHLNVEDVMRRTRHPRVDITRVGPYGGPEYDEDDPRGPKAIVCFQVFIGNLGRNLAHHVGAELHLPRPLVNNDVRARVLDDPEIRLTQRPGELIFFRYHPIPLFPGQEIFLQKLWVTVHAGNLDRYRCGALLRWRVYADDAKATEGSVNLRKFAVTRRAIKWVADLQREAEEADRSEEA